MSRNKKSTLAQGSAAAGKYRCDTIFFPPYIIVYIRGRLAYRPRSETANYIREVNKMREGIHPNYYQAKVVCNCGNEFVTGCLLYTSEVCDSGCQEKPLLCDTCPYRKPTQVDEERILRPAGEALLRNSAK